MSIPTYFVLCVGTGYLHSTIPTHYFKTLRDVNAEEDVLNLLMRKKLENRFEVFNFFQTLSCKLRFTKNVSIPDIKIILIPCISWYLFAALSCL